MRKISFIPIIILGLLGQALLYAQGPVIKTPTQALRPNVRTYPWHKNITATIFWIGEEPTPKNPVPNHASSWDTKWEKNFGGFDDPKRRAVIGYRPAAFIPKLNPFYIALPFNDRVNHKYIKPIVPKVVPWFTLQSVQKGKSCLKGRWVQIVYGKKSCFAQWEDCGPFNTTDWQYVFGNQRPKNPKNQGAGIDLSPSIRDYLGLKSGAKVHWRFVDEPMVSPGPWANYGLALNQQIAKATNKPKQRKLSEAEEKLIQQALGELRRKMEKERADRLAEIKRQIETAEKEGTFDVP